MIFTFGEVKTEDGRPKTQDRRWKMEDGRWKMEDGRWKMEDRSAKFRVILGKTRDSRRRYLSRIPRRNQGSPTAISSIIYPYFILASITQSN